MKTLSSASQAMLHPPKCSNIQFQRRLHHGEDDAPASRSQNNNTSQLGWCETHKKTNKNSKRSPKTKPSLPRKEINNMQGNETQIQKTTSQHIITKHTTIIPTGLPRT